MVVDGNGELTLQSFLSQSKDIVYKDFLNCVPGDLLLQILESLFGGNACLAIGIEFGGLLKARTGKP